MIPTIFKTIENDIKSRSEAKKELDSVITLSSQKNATIERLNAVFEPFGKSSRIRMLDEGAIVRSDGSVRLYICKGAIKKFYENLQDDYVGYVNYAHQSLDSFPLVLGTWTKQDLHLIEKEDGRFALDADIHLNEDMYFVKDLKTQGIPLSASVEMYPKFDRENSDKLQMPIVSEIFIAGVSIVGSPANVNSADIQLSKGDEDMDLKELLEELSEVAEVEETLSSEVEEVEETLSTEEETTEEETEETVEETATSDTEELESRIDGLIIERNELEAENKKLKEQLNELTSKNAKLSSKIENSIGKIESLIEQEKKTSNLSNTVLEVDGVFYRG